jgi:cell filamentation protein
MIDLDNFTESSNRAPGNKLGIADRSALSIAAADSVDRRLAELEASPICGGFDSTHLQLIHRHIFQDVYDWAGELRTIDANVAKASQVEKSLNNLFDRLSRENHLKGLSAEEWARGASLYIDGLRTIQPFVAGNEITIREFAVELARRNNLALRCDVAAEFAVGNSVVQIERQAQSANLRRIVMLAMDTSPCSLKPRRDRIIETGIDRIFSVGNPWL